jgi:hypothetical protein
MHTGTKDCEDDRRDSQKNEPANLTSAFASELYLCRFLAGHAAHLTSVPGL